LRRAPPRFSREASKVRRLASTQGYFDS
jgi:hypothetical protein